MAKNIQSVRGMNDYLPEETVLLQRLEEKLKNVLDGYSYREIRLPIVEQTSLFKRAIGTVTDIVEKEMYTFEDRNGDSLTLRPEGTAGCMRAGIEHGILYHQEQRLWYIGPMFRHERPQKGRYRQFYQLGVEVFGHYGPEIDAELIMITARWWRVLGISNYLSLELNSIGSQESRIHYYHALLTFLMQHIHYLDEDCRRRLHLNPLRILDSKNANIQELLNDAPLLSDYLDKDSQDHFLGLCKLLDIYGISYRINPRLVRGLDYYNKTVFEWVTRFKISLCSGGRYDSLAEQLGGHAIPAVGFAMGIERLVMLLKKVNSECSFFSAIDQFRVDVYLITTNDNLQVAAAMLLSEKIRDILPTLRLMTHYGRGSLKKKLGRADKYGARIALILGENEAEMKQVVMKDLSTGHQEILAQDTVAEKLALILKS